MTTKLKHHSLPKVILLLETSIEYGRGLLRGIARYGRTHGPWSLHASPSHFHRELPELESHEPIGIVARITTAKEAEAIANSGIPAIVLEPSSDEPAVSAEKLGLHEIRSNSSVIARMCADHLLGLNLTRFAFCGYRHCPWSITRQNTFSAHIQAHEFPCHIYQPQSRNSWKYNPTHFKKWLGSLSLPVGLMACNDMVGRQILEACSNLGIHVPDDIAVIGVDDDELLCDLSTPPLTSMALDLEAAGYAAAELLDQLMAGQRPRKRTIIDVNPSIIIQRRSTESVIQQDRRVAEALRFIRDHAGRLITIDDIASHLNISRRTLERDFCKEFNHSIYEELTRCRLERAKRLLRRTSLPVYKVATLSGFSDSQPMTRLFRRRENCTPLEYRNHCARRFPVR